MEQNLYISACGMGPAPAGHWYLSRDIEVQRLYCIEGGRGQYTNSDGTLSDFRPGTLYLFPYNLRDHFICDPADPIRHLYFDFLSTPPIIAAEPLRCPVEENSLLRQAIELARQTVTTHSSGQLEQEPLRTYLLQLLLELLDQTMPVPYCADDAICAALNTMQTRFAEPLTVDELARIAGFEENHFIRRFRTVMGQTPYAYLRSYRLMEARRLLAAGASSAYAAHQVGYDSAASLTRALGKSGVLH